MSQSQERVTPQCVFCRKAFLPPFQLPHLLLCTHSLCSGCLSRFERLIVCPLDQETTPLSYLHCHPSRKAHQRLLNEHKSFTHGNQLLSIQALSKHLQVKLQSTMGQQDELKQLFERVIQNEVRRLKTVQKNFLEQMERPVKMVKEWRQMVKDYLFSLKQPAKNLLSSHIEQQLSFYIEEGRKIKKDLEQYRKLDFDQLALAIATNPSVCLQPAFSLQMYLKRSSHEGQPEANCSKKNNREGGQVVFQEVINQVKDCKQEFQTSDRAELYLPCRQPLNPNNRRNQENIASSQKLLMYSESKDVLVARPDLQTEEILLTEDQPRSISYKSRGHNNQKAHQKMNFLQEWQVSRYLPSENISVEKREPFNWEKEQNSYIRKMQMIKVQDAINHTDCNLGCLQLINYSVSDLDLGLYLQGWDWSGLEVVKLVKCGLGDQQFNQLLNFTFESSVSSLVLSGNCLSELSLDALLNYTRVNSTLKSVYLSKNSINTLKGHTREKITLLREHGITLYI